MNCFGCSLMHRVRHLDWIITIAPKLVVGFPASSAIPADNRLVQFLKLGNRFVDVETENLFGNVGFILLARRFTADHFSVANSIWLLWFSAIYRFSNFNTCACLSNSYNHGIHSKNKSLRLRWGRHRIGRLNCRRGQRLRLSDLGIRLRESSHGTRRGRQLFAARFFGGTALGRSLVLALAAEESHGWTFSEICIDSTGCTCLRNWWFNILRWWDETSKTIDHERHTNIQYLHFMAHQHSIFTLD